MVRRAGRVAGSWTAILAASGWAATNVSSAQAAEPACNPFTYDVGQGVGPDTTVTGQQGTVGGARRATQYYPDGRYRTTICDDAGRPVKEVEAAPVELSDGRIVYVPASGKLRDAFGRVDGITAELGDPDLSLVPVPDSQLEANARFALAPLDRDRLADPEFTRASAKERAVVARLRQVQKSTGRRAIVFKRRAKGAPVFDSTRPSSELAPAFSKQIPFDNDYAYKCLERVNSRLGGHWSGGQLPMVYTAFFGARQYDETFRNSMQAALNTWTTRWNSCGLPRGPQKLSYAGFTKTGKTTWDLNGNYNGNSELITDYGRCDNLKNGDGSPMTGYDPANTLALTKYRYNADNGLAYTANMRMCQQWPWTDGAYPGYYDLYSVMAHEAGHMWGMDHAPYNKWLTMAPGIASDDASKRQLGLSDWENIDVVYP